MARGFAPCQLLAGLWPAALEPQKKSQKTASNTRLMRIIGYVFLVVLDIVVYVALGVALMNYDDKHSDLESEYGSWKSMTDFDKSVSVLMIIWNIVNALALAYIIYSVYKKIKFRTQATNS